MKKLLTLLPFIFLTVETWGQTITDSLLNKYNEEILKENNFGLQNERINKLELSLGSFYKQRQSGLNTILIGIGIQTLGVSVLSFSKKDDNPDFTPIYIVLAGGGITTLTGTIIYIDSNKYLKKYRNTIY